MEILWLAIILYSLGLGLVLHFRPALMFNENGTWKEFGYQRSPESRFTIFPFWLFAISWAFLSYALAATVSWIYPTVGTVAALESLDRFRSSNIPVDPHSFGPAPVPASYEEEEEEEAEGQYERPMGNGEVYDEETEVVEVPVIKRGRGRPRKQEVKPGYYVLDPATTSGLRKYIYYGTAPPES